MKPMLLRSRRRGLLRYVVVRYAKANQRARAEKPRNFAQLTVTSNVTNITTTTTRPHPGFGVSVFCYFGNKGIPQAAQHC